MAEADILLLLQQPYENSNGNIPLKLFDYLSMQKYILAFGTKEGRTNEIISTTRTGNLFSYNDNLDIDLVIKSSRVSQSNKEEIMKYSSPVSAKKFVEIFNSLT